MRRLYLQLYLTVVASLVVFAIAAGWLWRVLVEVAPPPHAYALASEIAQGALPPADAPREALMDFVRGESLEAFDRSIDVHVSRIRSAIEDDPKKPRRIITVRGAGYVFARSQDGDA